MIRILSLAVLASCAAVPASAQTAPQCMGLADAMAALQSDYGETVRASGLIDDKTMMLVTAADSGTWTVLLISADGQACFMAAGVGFMEVAPGQTVAPGDPA